MLATIARRQALKDLVPPKIATPSAVVRYIYLFYDTFNELYSLAQKLALE